MVQYKMSKNLKQRAVTSTILFLLLALSFINNFILGYILIITAIFSVLEFAKIINIIYKKYRIKKFLYNSIFIIYIFYFFTIFLSFSNSLYLKIIIFLILLTCVASDIGGFTSGKIFKGPKLTKISPKKTISGAIGSVIFSIIFLSLIIFYLTKDFEPLILVIAFITSISCQLGDLFFSFLKRKSFLKNTGNFLPGHGGIIDRIDGILFGLPIGFLTMLIIY